MPGDTRQIGLDLDGREQTIRFISIGSGLYQFHEPPKGTILPRCHEAFSSVGAPFDQTTKTWLADATQACAVVPRLAAGQDERQRRVDTPYGPVRTTPAVNGNLWTMPIGSASQQRLYAQKMTALGIRENDKPSGSWFTTPVQWTALLGDDPPTTISQEDQAPERFEPNRTSGLMIAMRGHKIDRDWHRHPSRCRDVTFRGHDYHLHTIEGRYVACAKISGGCNALRDVLGILPWEDRIDGVALTTAQVAIFDGGPIPPASRHPTPNGTTTSGQGVFEFDATTPLGTIVHADGNSAALIAIEDYVRKTDGKPSLLMRWEARCEVCGIPVTHTSGRRLTDFRPRCAEHRSMVVSR